MRAGLSMKREKKVRREINSKHHRLHPAEQTPTQQQLLLKKCSNHRSSHHQTSDQICSFSASSLKIFFGFQSYDRTEEEIRRRHVGFS